MIRVVVVAAAPAVRAGLKALLESDPEIMVTAAAEGPAEAEHDAVLWDVCVAVEAGRGFSFSSDDPLPANAAVLWLACGPEPAVPAWLRRRPAWGILALDSSAEELSAAVHALAEGLVVADPSILDAVLALVPVAERPAASSPEMPLTEREVEVLALLARGLANKQIADALAISIHTVKFHISSIYAKLGASSRTEAVRMGLQQGILSL